MIDVDDRFNNKLLPPLTLQILLDNALKINLISKDKPLTINIHVNNSGWLEIDNNIQLRMAGSNASNDHGITNISTRLRLLCHQVIDITDDGINRIMKVPLINSLLIPEHESI